MIDFIRLLNILEEVSYDFDHLHFGFWLPIAENRLKLETSLRFD
jgi:hypothetical protein